MHSHAGVISTGLLHTVNGHSPDLTVDRCAIQRDDRGGLVNGCGQVRQSRVDVAYEFGRNLAQIALIRRHIHRAVRVVVCGYLVCKDSTVDGDRPDFGWDILPLEREGNVGIMVSAIRCRTRRIK